MPDTMTRKGSMMNIKSAVAALLAVSLSAPSFAQTAEALSAGGAARFQAAAYGLSGLQFRPVTPAVPRLTQADFQEIEQDISNQTRILNPTRIQQAAGPAISAELELAPLLNRHLKTSLHYVLSGKNVWFSGAFDKAQNPYVSILADGQNPYFFNVKALVHQDQRLYIGRQTYTLSLSANIFHKMKSHIVLTNDANDNEKASFTVQDMLDAVDRAGQPVKLSNQAYKFYYADGINGAYADPRQRLFAFIYGSSSDFHVFLIPESSVPADKIAVFQMFNGKRVGLARPNGRLQVYENP